MFGKCGTGNGSGAEVAHVRCREAKASGLRKRRRAFLGIRIAQVEMFANMIFEIACCGVRCSVFGKMHFGAMVAGGG